MKLLMKHCDILVAHESDLCCLEDAYLGVNGDTIDYIGKDKPQTTYDREKDMSDRLLLPGLINCHNHSPMVMLRGVGSGLSLQEWLFRKMMPIEDKLTAEDIKVGNQLALLEMISTGTTSYSDMYFEPRIIVENVLDCGIKANIGRPAQCFNQNETYAENSQARESIQLFKDYHGAGDGRVRIDFSIHAEYTCFDHIVGPYSDECKSLGGRMHIHLSETKKEHDECVKKYGKTPTKWFYDLGTFDSPTAAAHCVWVTDEDMGLMMEKGVSPVHNPTSNMKLGSGVAPVQRMMDLGINVALGTDGAASNNNLNLMEELHLAAVLHSGFHRNPSILTLTQLLNMVTRNGAKLQGREDTGELAVGKKADIIALNLSRPHMVPNLDPMALIVYSAQGSDVVMTMVDGKILYEDGEFLTLDADKIIYETRTVVKRLNI